jgi:hypothetical protein
MRVAVITKVCCKTQDIKWPRILVVTWDVVLVWGKLRLVLVWAWVQTSAIVTQLPATFSVPPEKHPGNSPNDVTGGWSCNCKTIVRASLQAVSDVKCGQSVSVIKHSSVDVILNVWTDMWLGAVSVVAGCAGHRAVRKKNLGPDQTRPDQTRPDHSSC